MELIKQKLIESKVKEEDMKFDIEIYKNLNQNIITKAKLEDYFTLIYSKEAVKELKLNPEIHYKVLKELNVKPEDCLIVEDSLIGVEAAKNANIEVAVMYDKYSECNRETINKMAQYKFADFKEMLGAIKTEVDDKQTMKKVIVIGSPGAGKSVFSKKLSKITNLPLYHLDMIYHKKDGIQISKTEFDKKLKEILEKDEWIIDGNYQRTLELRLKECDTVFLLDYPVDVCIRGAKDRVGTKRDDLPWVEESLNEEFKKSILEFPNTKLIEIYNLLDKNKNTKEIIIFKTREEADKYLKEGN